MEVLDQWWNDNVEATVATWASGSGLPLDQFKYILGLILQIPLGFAFKALPNSPTLKHLVSIFASIALSTFTLGKWSWVHSFISSTVTYLIIRVIPHGTAHKVAFVWVLGYLSAGHIYRQYTDYLGWTMDWTLPQMILTVKLTSFAYNIYDGKRKKEELTPEQDKRAVRTMPTILEFYGFVYFFCSFIAGPSFEYHQYSRFINMKDRIPSSVLPTILNFGRAVILLPCVFLAMNHLSMDYFFTEKYLAEPLWLRLLRTWIHPSLCRLRYYFAWYLSECGFIACGMGYNGLSKSGSALWNAGTNARPITCELGMNMREITGEWNACISDWLKNYVYLRVVPEGKKPQLSHSIITYMVSAFWHGFYPGYYVFFVLCAFQTEFGKEARRRFRHHFVNADGTDKPTKIIYDVLGWAFSISNISFGGGAFLVLSWDRAISFWSSVYFIPAIACVVGFFVISAMPVPKGVPSSTPIPRREQATKSN